MILQCIALLPGSVDPVVAHSSLNMIHPINARLPRLFKAGQYLTSLVRHAGSAPFRARRGKHSPPLSPRRVAPVIHCVPGIAIQPGLAAKAATFRNRYISPI